MPSLSEISSEFELYNYLKDGTELCRMIGLIAQGRVLDGVIYRANNISCLEEKNVSLFLSFVESEFKLQNLFGAHRNQALGTFTNFHVVLSGLARLSREVHRKLKIPKFISSGKKTEVYHEDTTSNMIQGYKEEDENKTDVCR